jgi:hypothetical protein
VTIRDLKKFMDSLWDWGFLDGCFGNTGSRIGDVDGILSHCGEVLLLEGKPMSCAPEIGQRWAGAGAKRNGQARLWADLVGRGITVMILWGETQDLGNPMKKVPRRIQIWRRFQPEPDLVKECTVTTARHYVARWWAWAESTNQVDLAS